MTRQITTTLISSTALFLLGGTALATPDRDYQEARNEVYQINSCYVSVFGGSVLYWGPTDETFEEQYQFSGYQGAEEAEPFTGYFLEGAMNLYYGNELTKAQSHSWAQSVRGSDGFTLASYCQMKAEAYEPGGSATAIAYSRGSIWVEFEVLEPAHVHIETITDGFLLDNGNDAMLLEVNWHRKLYMHGAHGAEFLFSDPACEDEFTGLQAC